VSPLLNYSTMTDSNPHWMDYILERITYHKDRQQTATELNDLATADLHAAVVDELNDIVATFRGY